MSERAKHTPGPWYVMAGMPSNVLSAGGLRVARCDFDGNFDSAEARANAKLMAAAPDMFAALEAWTDWLDKYGKDFHGPCIDDARAALAKARGEVGA